MKQLCLVIIVFLFVAAPQNQSLVAMLSPRGALIRA